MATRGEDMKEVYQPGNARRGRGVGRPMRSTPVIAFGVLSLFLLACEGEAAQAVEGITSPTPAAEANKPATEAAPAPDWQALAGKALTEAGEPGTVIVMDAKEGKVLGLAEKGGQVEHPATAARHPASSIKPIVAVAAIAEGKLSPKDEVSCAGPREIDGQTYTCFHDHGAVTLDRAMRTSCNHFAYEVATRLSLEEINKHLGIFGYGRSTGLAPDGVPEAEGKLLSGGKIEGAIGHGELLATPLQIAKAYTALATGRIPARVEAPLPYREDQLERVRKGLLGTVQHEEGSGHDARIDGLAIAGKTGTAELEPKETDEAKYLSYFASWAPADDPQIVVVVQLESKSAAPDSAVPAVRPIYEALKGSR